MENGTSNGQIREKEVQHMRTPNYNNNNVIGKPVPSRIPRPLESLPVVRSPRQRKQYSGRKLVLHFDVRNTILVADSIDNISVEQALNSFLTGVTWGKQTTNGWEWYSDKPSLGSPNPDAITYYKHLENKLVRVPSDRPLLRKATGDFTQEDIGRKFGLYFQRTLKHLEWHHSHNKALTMEGKDGKPYHYILPSFYKLIYHLHKAKRDFSIVIRTYGLDARNVLQSINLTLSGIHPEFPEPLPIKVDMNYGKVQRKLDSISMQIPGRSNQSTSVLRDDRTIFNYLSDTTGISGFVDDFPHWQNNDYHSSSAKPLWIDPSRSQVHHIFFDDNIRVTDEDSIVDVRVFDSSVSGKARSLSQEDAKTFENMCLVQADLLESARNSDYFINKVDKCERLYDGYLQSVSKR